MRSAKELCAMLITRGIKTLSEDEEDVVVDYLSDLGIDADIDDSPKELCLKLLDKTMIKDMGKKVPLTAYSNSILSDVVKTQDIKNVEKEKKELKEKRKNRQTNLQNQISLLPGCIPDDTGIFRKTLYSFIVNPDVGINVFNDFNNNNNGDEKIYGAEVSINTDLYSKVFLNITNPILELTTATGNKGYAKITSLHNDDSSLIYISPLVGSILNVNNRTDGTVRLCITIPFIKKIDFTYYGDNIMLSKILEKLIMKLPKVINAFSYLSLGMVLRLMIDDQEVNVRVDRLYDDEDDPIFVGLIKPGESDLPFDIVADI